MNLTGLVVGIGSMIAGGRAVRDALKPSEPVTVEDVGEVQAHTVRSIDDRIRHIVALIRKGREHPAVRAKTAEILSRRCPRPGGGETWCIAERDWEREVVAIFQAVRDHVRYTRDTYGADLYQGAHRSLQFRIGDCDDGVIVLASMLPSVGYPVKLRVIRTKGAKDWDHIYLLVALPPRSPQRWVALDPSVNKPAGWQLARGSVGSSRDFTVT